MPNIFNSYSPFFISFMGVDTIFILFILIFIKPHDFKAKLLAILVPLSRIVYFVVHMYVNDKYVFIFVNSAPYILFFIFANYMITFWRDCYVRIEVMEMKNIESNSDISFSETTPDKLDVSLQSALDSSSFEMLKSVQSNVDSKNRMEQLNKMQIRGGILWIIVCLVFFVLAAVLDNIPALCVFVVGTVYLSLTYMLGFCILYYVFEPMLYLSTKDLCGGLKIIALSLLALTVFNSLPMISYNFLVNYFFYIYGGYFFFELVSIYTFMRMHGRIRDQRDLYYKNEGTQVPLEDLSPQPNRKKIHPKQNKGKNKGR